MHERPPLPPADMLVDQVEQQGASIQEHFAETVFEYAGQQGTLQQLVDMCPVPPHQRSVAASERFAAKLIEQAGLTIPEQFAHLRSESRDVTDQSEVSKTSRIEKLEKPQALTRKPEISVPQGQAGGPPEEATATGMVEATLAGEPTGLDSGEEKHTEQAEDSIGQPPLAAAPVPQGGVEQAEVISPLVNTVPEGQPEMVATMMPIAKTISTAENFMSADPTHSSVDIEGVVEASDLSKLLGDLYESAALEVAEHETRHDAPETQGETIADLLEITDREVVMFNVDELLLPAVQDTPLLNTLSISSSNRATDFELPTDSKPAILRALLPEATTSYQAQLEALPPAVAEQLTELVENMGLIAERLQILVASERSESPEAAQIQEVMEQYYDQMYNLLEMPIDAEERQKFITAICSDGFQKVLEAAFYLPADEGTHEFKRVVISQAHQLPVLMHQTAKLARFIIRLGVSPTVS